MGPALISGGATGLTGGFILIGLSAVVGELARLANDLKGNELRVGERRGDGLEGLAAPVVAAPMPPVPATVSAPGRQPAPNLPLPPRPRTDFPAQEGRPVVHPASPSSVEVSAAAIERLRSTIPRTETGRVEPAAPGYSEEAPLSPNGAAASHQGMARTRAEPAPPEASEDRTDNAVEALKASRLDFLFRTKPARPPQAEHTEAPWQDARTSRSPVPPTEPPATKPGALDRQAATAAPSLPQLRPNTPPPEAPASPGILKSGVVDGMAYTLYTDGSIEAKLPQGMVRFGSVAELRAHIEGNSSNG